MLPPGELVARPQTETNWWEDVQNDLLHGGGRTIVGRGLGHLQGRVDKGYSGLEAGTTPETAQLMGSVPLAIAQAGKGESQIREGHPISGTGNLLGAGLKAMTLPSMFLAPEAADAAISAIPSRAHAGQILQDIRGAAQDVPAYPQQAWPEIERFKELTQRGGASSKPITQINRRLTNIVRDPNAGPFNFPEARDFYSNISSQSSEDMSRLNPIMRRQMGAVRQAMHGDLTNAASTIGRGEDYASAVKEYAQAMKMRNAVINAAKYGIPTAVGTGIGAHYLRDLIPSK